KKIDMKLQMKNYDKRVLADKALLAHTLGAELFAEGDESELVAASWHEKLDIVAMVCYLEDPGFPQVRILNCKTAELFDLDCNDLIDSPIIQGITLLETPGELELQFTNGDKRVVFYRLEDKIVLWQ
ncbi:MAG: hypothetical protein AAAB16_15640, partial [Pseudomonas sp.]|uniref:hypothetical protein n=1 Tax=Pseudomonas sp. TaxID=306 RepID=UPI0030EFEB24